MSFFQKLYEGGYAPINAVTPDTEEYKSNHRIMVEAGEKLRKTLTQEQTELFDLHQKAEIACEELLHVQTFQQGFCIGVEFQKEFKETDHLPEEE